MLINEWWFSRRIPASRKGINELFWNLDNISLDVYGDPWQPQPFREVFASKIAAVLLRQFGEKWVVPYSLFRNEEFVYSVCPNFVTTDTEYVPFNQIRRAYKKLNHVSEFDFCRSFYKDKAWLLDLTLITDYIVLNEDRHFGNFGLIRNVNTGEFVYPAPLFDTGSSLFFESASLNRNRINAKPFNKDFKKQISLVDVSRYYGEIKEVSKVYKDLFYETFLDCFEEDNRLLGLVDCISEQIDPLLI